MHLVNWGNRHPPEFATGKKLLNRVSRIFSQKSAENFVSRNSAGKKFG